jgi:hypothetical protein
MSTAMAQIKTRNRVAAKKFHFALRFLVGSAAVLASRLGRM